MLAEIDQFVNWVRRRNPEARTWKDYRYDLRQFAALVGDVPPGAITFREVDRFVDLQKTRGFLPTTINRRLASLISFYTFLSDEDPDLVCPVLPRRHNLRERERLPRPVQEDGLRAFFAAIDATLPAKGEPDNRVRDRAMFVLMLRCGLRIGEVAGVRLTDLYLDEPHARAWWPTAKARATVRSTSLRRRSGRCAATCASAPRLPMSTSFSATSSPVFPPPPSTNGSWSTAKPPGFHSLPTVYATVLPTICSTPTCR